MFLNNPLHNLSSSIGHAVFTNVFSEIMYEDVCWKTKEKIQKTRKVSENEIEVYAMFVQTWGSTALGFGGIGGAAMTTAYTIVLYSPSTNEFAVYFNGRFAYCIQAPSRKFFDDITNKDMQETSKQHMYRRN